MHSTKEMLELVIMANGNCLEVERIINSNWISTYFIFLTKPMGNEINFVVDYQGEKQIWTNADFNELFPNEKWRLDW
jgi:hypothetical protein